MSLPQEFIDELDQASAWDERNAWRDRDPKRATALDGMRMLLDTLEANPDMPLPNQFNPDAGTIPGLDLYLFHPTYARDQIAALRRATPGWWVTTVDNTPERPQLVMTADIGGVPLTVRATLEDVAEQIVTGTTTVETIEWTIDGVPVGQVA